MAKIDSRGFVDDGSSHLSIAGDLNVRGVISSSAGSFAEIATFDNQVGQTLTTANTWYIVTQWLSQSISSPGSLPQTASIAYVQPDMYYTCCSLSFSGSAGVYTLALFSDGVQERDSTLQATISTGQSKPNNLTISDMEYENSGTVHDLRVQCSLAGASFLMNYGNFLSFRIGG